MKKIFCALLLLSSFLFPQRDDTKLIWYDAYTTTSPKYGSTVVVSDSIADNAITIKKGDTLYVDLYVSRVISSFTDEIQHFTYLMYYGHN